MRHVRVLQVVLLTAALGARLAAEDYIPLQVRPLDEVTLKDGNVIKCHVVQRLTDSIVIRVPGVAAQRTIPNDMINGDVLLKQTAAQVVHARSAQDIEANDVHDLQSTLNWGMANNAKEVVLSVAHDALTKNQSTELAETVLPFLIDASDDDAALEVLDPLMVKNPQWSKGYELKARILKDTHKDGDLAKLIDQWLQMEPSAQVPNRYHAAAAETTGDLHNAREAYRKGFTLYNDYESGLGFARTSLKLGMAADAITTAEALIKAGQLIDESRAIEGAADLALNHGEQALPLLTQALAGKLSPDTQAWVHYDLGLISYRAMQFDQAREQWKDLALPVAKLGMAMLDHQSFAADDASPEMRPMVTEYNACVALETGHFDAARAMLDPSSSPRQEFLSEVAALKNPTDDVLRTLAANPSPESLRWQVYAFILSHKWAQAEAVVAQLPDNDGYAAVCRVYLAEARKDTAGARAAFDKVKDSVNPPAEYVRLLGKAYEEAADEIFSEKFDCTSDALSTRDVPWTFIAPGTSIEIHTDNDKLIFAGTQTAGQDSVTRLYRHVAAPALRWAQATFDLAGANGAFCGLEVLDSDMANGVAFAVQGDNHLGWRQETSGTWGAWQALDADAHPTQILRMELDQGALTLVFPDDTPKRWRVAEGLFKDQGQLTVSIFGSADPGTQWTVAVHDFLMQMRSLTKSPGH
jgi:hypothetical protein